MICHSKEQIAVERAVLDGFEDVVGADRVAAGQVRQRARHLEDAVMGAGGKVELHHRLFEISRAFGVEFAMFAHQAGGHGRVG